MTDSTTPIDPMARLRDLNERRRRAELAVIEAGYRHRIVAAAGIDPDDLSEQGRRILRWLSQWDDWTVGGLEEILTATCAASQKQPGPSRPARREGLGL